MLVKDDCSIFLCDKPNILLYRRKGFNDIQDKTKCELLIIFSEFIATMARGNQREMAREKAAKKDKGKAKAADQQGANAGMTKEQRMERFCI